jgi:hypothetical protein
MYIYIMIIVLGYSPGMASHTSMETIKVEYQTMSACKQSIEKVEDDLRRFRAEATCVREYRSGL